MGCVQSTPTVQTPRRSGRTKSAKPSYKKKVRLVSKFTEQQIHMVTDQERKAGYHPVYACPICTNRFDTCDSCQNCICRQCYLTYEKKSKKDFKCSFCGSESSMFRDYEQAAHSYFDNTGEGGFISKEERQKIDQEIKQKGEQARLETIKQIQAN